MLREHGEFEIHVAARNNLSEKNGLKLDFVDRIFDIPFERSPFNFHNVKAYKQLKRIIDENGYDYVHCNTPVGGVVTRLAARKARKSGTRVLYTAHGFHFYKGASMKNWLTYYPVEKILAKLTDILITINEEDYRLAKERFSCHVARIHGIGVNAERYYPVSPQESIGLKKQYGFSAEDRILLCVGELLQNKNQQQIIKAMPRIIKAVPTAKLLLAGNGPNREGLDALVKELQIQDHVVFLGYCTVLQDYQRFTDVGISCSIREGLGVNLIEAMMNNNPVVATKNRGHNELVIDGVNGYLVDVDDVVGMSDAVVSLMNNFEDANDKGKKGMQMASQYTDVAVKKELVHIYFGVF